MTIFNLLLNVGFLCISLALIGGAIVVSMAAFSSRNKEKTAESTSGKYMFIICLVSIALLILGVILCGTGFVMSLYYS